MFARISQYKKTLSFVATSMFLVTGGLFLMASFEAGAMMNSLKSTVEQPAQPSFETAEEAAFKTDDFFFVVPQTKQL